jgi:hypothetical protein
MRFGLISILDQQFIKLKVYNSKLEIIILSSLTFLKRGERLRGQPEAPHVRDVLVELVGGHAVAVQVAVVVVVVADDVAVAQRREHELRAERVAEQVGQILHCGQQLVRLDGRVRTRIPETRKATVLSSCGR